MSSHRMYYNGGSEVVTTSVLTSAINYVHLNDDGKANRGFAWLTVAWSHANSAATALAWTAEITMDGTNYVDITESIIQSGADEMEQHDPTIAVTGNTTGTFTVPMPSGRKCRVTCTATAADGSDTISWRACAHD